MISITRPSAINGLLCNGKKVDDDHRHGGVILLHQLVQSFGEVDGIGVGLVGVFGGDGFVADIHAGNSDSYFTAHVIWTAGNCSIYRFKNGTNQ